MRKKTVSSLLVICILCTIVFGTVPYNTFAFSDKKDLGIDNFEGKLYFGNTSAVTTPALYRLVAKSAEDITLFYDGKNIAESKMKYDESSHNAWKESDICNWLNGTGFIDKEGVFTKAEKDSIITYGETEITYGQTIDISQKIVLPSYEEVDDGGAWGMNAYIRKKRGLEWWLRTPNKDNPEAGVAVFYDGNISISDARVENEYGVCPSFKLKKDSILLTSEAEGGKSGVAKPALEPVSVSNSLQKLTIINSYDENTNPEGLKSGNVVVNGANSNAGTAVKVMLTEASSNKAVSAIVKNNSGEITHYGKIGETDLNGNAKNLDLTLPVNIGAGGNTLEIFVEEINEAYKTDYASTPVAITEVIFVPITSIEIQLPEGKDKSNPVFFTGEKLKLSVKIEPENATVTDVIWKISYYPEYADGSKIYNSGDLIRFNTIGQCFVDLKVKTGNINQYKNDSKVIRVRQSPIVGQQEVMPWGETFGINNLPEDSSDKSLRTTVIRYNDMDWYVVGTEKGGVAPLKDTMTLFTKKAVNSVFDDKAPYSNEYAGSALKAVIDKIADSFSSSEKSEMSLRNLEVSSYTESPPYCDGIAGTPVSNAILWPLSTAEGYCLNQELREKPTTSVWYLRSPGDRSDRVAKNSKLELFYSGTWGADIVLPVCYAFRLKLDNIRFTSLAEGNTATAEAKFEENRNIARTIRFDGSQKLSTAKISVNGDTVNYTAPQGSYIVAEINLGDKTYIYSKKLSLFGENEKLKFGSISGLPFDKEVTGRIWIEKTEDDLTYATMPCNISYRTPKQYEDMPTKTKISTPTKEDYPVEVKKTKGGNILEKSLEYSNGITRIYTIMPDEGYRIKDVIIDNRSVGAVSEFRFSDFSSRHSIEAIFEFENQNSKTEIKDTIQNEFQYKNKFKDVKESDWFYKAVMNLNNLGFMNGTTETSFEPRTKSTKAMVLTILYKMEGRPEIKNSGGKWYSPPQTWAVANGISDGLNMEEGITREQLITLIWRFESSPIIENYEGLMKFKDLDKIAPYAKQAFIWAHHSGIISGSQDKLSPKANATRSETAAIIFNYIKQK